MENIPLFVLIDENTNGLAEAHALLLKQNGLATLIGRKSGGNPGTPIGFTLPCGLSMALTGYYCGDINKEIYFGQSIQPDIEVKCSEQSIKNYIDNIYNKALEIINLK